MANTDHLADTLRTFSHTRSLLRDIYTSSVTYFSMMQNMLREDVIGSTLTEQEDTMFITKDGERLIEKVLNSDPVVIVSGQINCGKTSLINELLSGSYLPTSKLPCTARIVRIKYAEENYLQVCDELGAPIGERITFGKKVPSKEIALAADLRDDEMELQRIVEVGLNHPILAHGLQFVDVPGLSENQALDNLVAKVLDGMLQLLIYVIDGKTSLRTQDRTFLSYLKNLAPNIDIIFVCNKVEDDITAMKMDQFSDAENSDSDSERVDRAQLAFIKLQKSGLILPTQQYGLNLENYHGLSCKRVHEARTKKKKDLGEFMDNFCNFKAAVMNKFTSCVHFHLSNVLTLLSMTQKRLYDFFVMDKVIKQHKNELQFTILDFKRKEELFFEDMKEKVTDKWTSMIERMLETRLEQENIIIKEAVTSLEFQPIVLDDDLSANHVITACRLQVRDFVLMLAIAGFENEVLQIETWFNEEVKTNARRFTVDASDSETSILQIHLSSFWRMDDMNFDIATLKEQWVAGLRESVKTKLKQYYEDMKFIVKGTFHLDTKWKVETASAVLRSINPKTLAAHIVAAIKNKLQVDHTNFCFALNQINQLCGYKERQANHHRIVLREILPDYSRNLVVTEALLTTVKQGAVTLGKQIGKGSRMEVFECDDWSRNYNGRRTSQSLRLVAKKEIVKSPHPSTVFCTLYCYSRLMRDLDYQQKVTAVVYDKDWDFCIILPHYDGTLHDILMAGNTTLVQRMKICSDLTQLCFNASINGFRLNDVRLNNFLAKNSDGVLTVQYNLSKWMDQHAPLPDGGVPFHFAPEVMRGEKHDPNTFDAYSMAVFLLFMAIGRFARPRWSESEEKVRDLKSESDVKVMVKQIWEDFLDIFDTNWTGPKNLFYSTMLQVLKKYIAAKPYNRWVIARLMQDTKRLLDIARDLTVDEQTVVECARLDSSIQL